MLYTFGDSFIATRSNMKPDWSWTSLIATTYNTIEVPFGVHASSSQYTFNKFEENRDKFVKDDIVIIMLTLENKSNFFSDRPKLAIDWAFEVNDDPFIEQEKIAVEMYYKYLYNIDNVVVNTMNFLQSVEDVTIRKQLKTFVFTGFINSFHPTKERFPNIRFANGNLWDEQIKEISDKSLFNFLDYYKFTNDPRLLHFTKDNHKIIADKIIASIQNNDSIDFTIGLKQNVFGWNEYKLSAFNSTR
jgi:hypothetical protein